MLWLLNMKLKNAIIIIFLILTATTLALVYYHWNQTYEDGDALDVKNVLMNYIENTDEAQNFAIEEFDEEDGQDSGNFKVLDDGQYYDSDVSRFRNSIVHSLRDTENEKLPMIIWWTPFTGDYGRIKRCFVGDCYFTNNRTFYNHTQAKVFLFYGTNMKENDVPLPRKEHHEWGLLHEESPKNNPIFYHEITMNLFNYTSTFKQQSSYPLATQYINSAKYLLRPLTYTVEEKDKMKKKEGLASVLYVQSGCNPPSDRDAYVQELMKYIKIDCSGKCLHNKDMPAKISKTMAMFKKEYIQHIEKYKFIISFENARCNDYMTEKIFRTLHAGAVPIYMGAPNLREWLPDEKAVIMVDDYESPKELAERIKFLDENPKEYEKMLAYKINGITNKKLNETLNNRPWGVNSLRRMSSITGFECYVCDQIHRNKKLVAEGKEPIKHIATQEHYGCPKPHVFPYPDIPGTEDWERNLWVWEYDEGKNKAQKLYNAVVNTK